MIWLFILKNVNYLLLGRKRFTGMETPIFDFACKITKKKGISGVMTGAFSYPLIIFNSFLPIPSFLVMCFRDFIASAVAAR